MAPSPLYGYREAGLEPDEQPALLRENISFVLRSE